MAVTKNVAVVAMLVMAAFVAVCSATDLSNLYVYFKDSDNVEVFPGVTDSNSGQVTGFGEGKVFDYLVTDHIGGVLVEVARAQGLFYQSSNHGEEAFKEDFTILFVEDGKYTGNSFSFSGIWVSDTVHEFPIIGGTGDLKYTAKSIATLTRIAKTDNYKIYKLEVNQNVGTHFHNRLRA